MRLASTAALDLASSQERGTQNAEDVLQAAYIDGCVLYVSFTASNEHIRLEHMN